MDNLKKYQVNLEQRDVTIRTVTVSVEANTDDDARVLARYKKISSWEWTEKETQKHQPVITGIAEITNTPYKVEPAPTADVATVAVGAPGSDYPDMPL